MSVPTLSHITVPARPAEPAAALPGDDLVAAGAGFGAAPDAQSAVLITASSGPAVPAFIVQWAEDGIRFTVPSGLGPPGAKQVRVRTRQGSSGPATITLEDEPRLPAAPVALLPLGLQARFMAGGRELWIRAIPDMVHVDSHDPRLTTEEAALGIRYRDAGADRDDVWLDLTTRFGVPRAEWIVRATLAGAVATRDRPWARAARSRLLPRRLHAAAYDDAGTLIAAQHGRPIPFELPIGPDPTAPATADPTRDPGMAWLIDFTEAVNLGMGIRLALPDPPPDHIARLVVVGVETGQAAQDGAREFGDVLAAHRYTRGIGFLPEGTPTNATPSAPADPPPVGEGRPADAVAPPAPDGNADAAARALGLTARAAELFAGTPHADGGARLRHARRHMNAALWPATWGYFLHHMLAPVVPADRVDAARRHFTDWVRGCGQQPVLRIGTMPYGLLPVLPLDRWAALDEAAPLADLVAFLRDRLRPVWTASTAAVPRVSDAPPDGDPAGSGENPLLTVLSMQPTSVSFRGRTVLGMEFVDTAWRFIRDRLAADQVLDPAWHAEQLALARAALAAHGLDHWHPNLDRTVFAANYFPVPLPLVQAGAAAEPEPLSVDWLTVLQTADWRSLRQDAFALPGLDQRPLLYLLLRHSLLVAYLFAAGAIAPADPWRGGEPVLYGIDEIDDNLAAPRPLMVWDRLTAPSAAGPAKGELLDARPLPPLAGVRDAVAGLVGAPVRVLEQAAAETLDLCSHRLDAWLTSFAQRRLHRIRGTDGGLHLGGYGFLEDLVPAGVTGSAGYVHAPSVSHARAAAILASGFRSHPDGGGTRHPFGIDLSSDRVRAALSLLDGVRAGQPLGALLGYRFERALQDRGLARFIDDFRAIAPPPVSGTAPPGGAVESVGVRNVADALELHRRWLAAGRSLPDGWPGDAAGPALQAVFEELDDGVDAIGDILLTEGVYQLARGNADRAAAALQAAALPSGAPPELEAIDTPHAGAAVIHRLAVLLPGDLTTGNGWSPDPALARRAGAEPRLDAWAGRLLGDPKRVRYRVRYQDPGSGAVLAEQERRLDQLVPPLSPLDVVYAAVAAERSQLSELEQRIIYQAARTRPAGVPPDAVVRVIGSRQPELAEKIGLLELMELAEALRETLAGARPVTPDDLSLPESPGTAAVDLAELEARAAAAENALRTADSALDAAIAAPAAETLRSTLLGAAALGVPGAVPLSPFGDTTADRADLVAQAAVAHVEVRARLARVDELAVPAPGDPAGRVADATARISAVFGDLRAVPRFQAPPTGDPAQLDVQFAASSALQAGFPFAAVRWFQRLTRIRDGARRLGDTLLYADALGGADTFAFQVAQLPAVAGDRWLGLPFADGRPPSGQVSLVGHLPAGPLNPAGSLAGLLVEELTEVLPAPAKTTGLALHYNQPDAAPPQAILLAVPPRPGEDWTLPALREVVADTLELAKLRMVDLDALGEAGHFVPATYLGFNAKGVTVGTDFLFGRGAPLG
jgi:hypothetical protein